MDGQTTRAVGQYAVLFDNKMQNRVVDDILDGNNNINYEATALAADALGVGTFALTDNRDSKDYLVRRLADGNCWMVQNLDLELADFVGKDNTNGGLTPENTDLAGSGRAYWDPGKNAADRAYVFDTTISKTDQSSYFPVTSLNYLGSSEPLQFQSYDITGYYWGSACEDEPGIDNCTDPGTGVEVTTKNSASIARSYSNTINGGSIRYIPTNWNTGLTHDQTVAEDSDYPTAGASAYSTILTTTNSFAPTERASAGNQYDNSQNYESIANSTYYGTMYIGHYYNWYGAIAESVPWDTVTNASDSICPTGWTLPVVEKTVAETTTWANLFVTTYGIMYDDNTADTDESTPQGKALGPTTDVHKLPFSFVSGGYYSGANGDLTYRGRAGDYWTATTYSLSRQRNAYRLIFDYSPNLSPYASNGKSNGFTIRCVSHGTENQVTPPEDVVQSTCAANSICYDANGGTGDTMANTGSATFGSSKVLSAPTYTRSGYAFVGWSESKNAEADGAYIYGPNETITVPNLASEGMTLYAQWLAPENSSYTMQAFGRNETVKTCATMTDGNNGTTEERIALRDERDDNVYIVTKLKDGNCWMTSNLALNLADFAGKTTGTLLTPENTDLTASREDLSTLTIEGVGGEQSETISYWDPGMSMYKHAISLTCSNADTTVRDLATLQSSCPAVTPGVDGNYFSIASENLLGTSQSVQFQSGNQRGSSWHWGSKCSAPGVCDLTSSTSNAQAEMPREFHAERQVYGNYYNWYAATAETGKYSMTSANARAQGSICPKGWKLPTGGNGGDMYSLLTAAYNITASNNHMIRTQPFGFPFAGSFDADYSEVGNKIILWFPEAATNSAAYRMFHLDWQKNLLFNSNGTKFLGHNVRCIMK